MLKNLDNCLNATGIMFGVANIETILGIILLSLNIIIIIIKTGISVYHKIKNKDFNGVVEDLEELKDKIEEEIK